jgi:hypothetical protein
MVDGWWVVNDRPLLFCVSQMLGLACAYVTVQAYAEREPSLPPLLRFRWHSLGRAVAQAVSRRLPTSTARVQSQIRQCWHFLWTEWHWGGFSPGTSVSPANSYSTNCSTMKRSIFWDMTSYGPVKSIRDFGGTYRFHLRGRREPGKKQSIGWCLEIQFFSLTKARRWCGNYSLFIVKIVRNTNTLCGRLLRVL